MDKKSKHYVYSARTTEEGLAVLTKAKGERSWDEFINAAVAKYYTLDLSVISLPPSEFLAKRAEAKANKLADKAAKAVAAAKAKEEKAKAKAAADKEKKAKAGKAAKDKAANEAKAAKAGKEAEANTETIAVNPGETVETAAGVRISAPDTNTHAVKVPVTKTEAKRPKVVRKAANK